MLFKRRHKQDFVQRIRVMVWPRTGWRRSTQYLIKRILRLSGTPHAIALGCAAGVFASFTPFVGFHFAIGFAVAWVTGGNLIASALGTFIGNPLTFPLIWAMTFKLGNIMLGRGAGHPLNLDMSQGIMSHSLDVLLPIIKPMFIGSLPLGILAALACYFPIRGMVETYQARRRNRLRERALDTNREASVP